MLTETVGEVKAVVTEVTEAGVAIGNGADDTAVTVEAVVLLIPAPNPIVDDDNGKGVKATRFLFDKGGQVSRLVQLPPSAMTQTAFAILDTKIYNMQC